MSDKRWGRRAVENYKMGRYTVANPVLPNCHRAVSQGILSLQS